VIGYPSGQEVWVIDQVLGQDGWILMERGQYQAIFASGNIEVVGKQKSLFPLGPVIKCLILPVVFRKKNVLESHTVNPLLTKLFWSSWPNIGLMFSAKKKRTWPVSNYLERTIGQ